MSITDRLTELTKPEKNFLDSSAGKSLGDALYAFERTPPQTRLIEEIDQAFIGLADVFREHRLFTGRHQNFRTIGGLLTDDSFSSQFNVHLNPDYRYGSGRHSFNILSATTSSYSCCLVERPLPVRIGKKHTEDRFKERTTLDGALDNENLLHIISVATAYVSLCDRNTDWKKTTEVPFAIAGENGLFLGVIVPTEEKQHFNRLYFSAISNGDKPEISRYQWVPKSSAEIRTFIGFEEFKPAQKALYQTLRKYVHADVQEALTYKLFNYQSTVSMHNDTSEFLKNYEAAEETLRSLSQSKTWKSGVRAPNMQYLGNGVLKPKY